MRNLSTNIDLSSRASSSRLRAHAIDEKDSRIHSLSGATLKFMILVVDNDPSFLERAREILNRTRQVFLASNAERAFELAGTLGFSVALVDLDLAGDGLELIRKLHLAVPDLLIIAMRSKVQKHGFLNDIQELGVVEVLDKPITQEWKPVVENVRAAHARGNPPTPP